MNELLELETPEEIDARLHFDRDRGPLVETLLNILWSPAIAVYLVVDLIARRRR